MLETYLILKDDEVVGEISYNGKDAKVSFDLESEGAPHLFKSKYKHGVYTLSTELSNIWLGDRVIPSTRQNILNVLEELEMSEYDPWEMFKKFEGRCGSDKYYIRRK